MPGGLCSQLCFPVGSDLTVRCHYGRMSFPTDEVTDFPRKDTYVNIVPREQDLSTGVRLMQMACATGLCCLAAIAERTQRRKCDTRGCVSVPCCAPGAWSMHTHSGRGRVLSIQLLLETQSRPAELSSEVTTMHT